MYVLELSSCHSHDLQLHVQDSIGSFLKLLLSQQSHTQIIMLFFSVGNDDSESGYLKETKRTPDGRHTFLASDNV